MYVDVGSAEAFRDEDVEYAARIRAAGGTAELHVWPGGYHAFTLDVPSAALSVQARAARLAWLRRLLQPYGNDAATLLIGPGEKLGAQ